jgi:hypothetical protein
MCYVYLGWCVRGITPSEGMLAVQKCVMFDFVAYILPDIHLSFHFSYCIVSALYPCFLVDILIILAVSYCYALHKQ